MTLVAVEHGSHWKSADAMKPSALSASGEIVVRFSRSDVPSNNAPGAFETGSV